MEVDNATIPGKSLPPPMKVQADRLNTKDPYIKWGPRQWVGAYTVGPHQHNPPQHDGQGRACINLHFLITNTTLRLIGFSFVDSWAGGLVAAGGELSPEKSFCHLLDC